MKKLVPAILTIFGSSYSYETFFSSMNYIKSSTRNRLGIYMSDARIKLNTTKCMNLELWWISTLATKSQQHFSHEKNIGKYFRVTHLCLWKIFKCRRWPGNYKISPSLVYNISIMGKIIYIIKIIREVDI